jgi:glycosyltransferase involved in cell wall biosynthesis/lipid II:glycine glycyltransferase (peptidoglycan interpeptide bridge formation enzyme)
MVVHAYYPIGETRVQREALALIDRGYEVEVVCLRGRDEPWRSTHDGVVVHRVPVARHRDRGFAAQLLEYLAFFTFAAMVVTARHLRRRFTAVQVHNLPDFLVFAALAPKLTGTPVLLDLHDLMPEFFASRTGSGLDSPAVRLVRWQEHLACRFADHVITVTDGWRDTLISRGVPPGKVSVVMNVADARLFQRISDAAGRPAGVGLHLLYHGTFTRRYGVDLLVDAVARVRDELPDIHLTLLGDGDLRSDLLAQRERLGLRDHVTISDGMVAAADLPTAIRAADAGVVPTRSDVFTDGLLPTKLMEFVAMGTPVIAARTPTVASYFDDDMVEFFPPGDAAALARTIRALAGDRERLATLADNADTFNRKYDSASTAAGYAGALDAVIRHGATPASGPHRRRGPASTRSRPASNAPAAIHITTSSAAHDAAWDAFLSNLPGGHHTQTSLWAQVKAAMGWRAVRIVAQREGDVVGGAQILYRDLPALGAVGYVSRGPVLAGDEPDLGARVMDEMERVARELRIRHLTVQPHGVGAAPPPHLTGRGYLATATDVAPRATVIVDVTPEPEQILAAMTPKTRYNVRLSGRRSVVVREGGPDDLDTYYRLLEATAQRQGFTPHPKAYFETMLRVLVPHGHLRLAFAEVDGEAFSGQIAIAFGDTVVNKLSVWSGRDGSRHPNEALHWSTIQWAHARGYRHYDLEGLKLEAAQAIARGEPLPPSAGQSVTSFKLGFGGAATVMPGPHVYVPNAVLRWGFAEFYPRVTGLRVVKRAIKRMRTGAGPAGTREQRWSRWPR